MKAIFIYIILVACLLCSCVPTPTPTSSFGDLKTATPTPLTVTPVSIPYNDSLTLTPPTEIFTPTATNIPFPYAITTQKGFCYNGPSERYQQAAAMLENVFLTVLSKSDGNDWFLVQGDNSVGRCWIQTAGLFYQFDLGLVPILYTAITKSDSTCRTGPSMLFREQTYIPGGWRLSINGKNSIEAEWTLVTPHDSTKQCWVASHLLTTINSAPIDFFIIALAETPTMPPPLVFDNNPGGGNPGNGEGDGGGGGSGGNPGGGDAGGGSEPAKTPGPTNPPPPTATLCWPPGKCK